MAVRSLLLLVAISLCMTRAENNQTYIFGFPLPIEPEFSKATLVITTASNINISFTVTINNELVSTGSVNVEHSEEITINSQNFTIDSLFQNRHKAIIVEAAGSISVMAYSWSSYLGTTGALNVVPYTKYFTLTEYRYYGVSVRSHPQNSLMLLVGSDNDTTVQVIPSVNVYLPVDIQQDSSLTLVQAGTSYSFVLHRGQTLLLKTPDDDLSGTKVLSNKPLTVISGHECGKIPENKGRCDQILAQIPPTVTWGKTFVLQPFMGRTSGQFIKVISADNDTIVQHDCSIDESVTTTTLSTGGDTLEFNSSSFKACLVQSNRPILVAQFSKGLDTDGLGDPAMIIVPPLEQYTPQHISFKGLPENQAKTQYANIIVSSQNFNRTLVHLDHKRMECDWSMVYAINSTNEIAAYTCAVQITPSNIHTIVSVFPSAIMIYGFLTYTTRNGELRGQGYGYSTATNTVLSPLNAVIRVKFSVSEYRVNESDGFVTVEVWRMDNVPLQAHVLVKTESGTALFQKDFNATQEMLTFEVGEMHKQVKIPIIDDEWMEDTEQFKVIVQPLAILSSSFVNYATIEILDDDDLKIGFSTHHTPEGKTDLQVDTFSGKLHPDVPPALVHLKIQFLTSDMASLYSEEINISHNLTNTTIPCPFCNDSNPVTPPSTTSTQTVIGVLELLDSEGVNKTRIRLSPSFTLIQVASTVQPPPIAPPLGHTQPHNTPLPNIMTQPTQEAVPPSTELVIIVGFASSFATLMVAIIIGMLGCYFSYRYGKEYGYRYQYFKPVKHDRDAIETRQFFVQTVNNC